MAKSTLYATSKPQERSSSNIKTLRPEQREACDFMLSGSATLFGASTGFGKSLATLHAVNQWLKEEAPAKCIIAAPPSVLDTWMNEFNDLDPDTTVIKPVILRGTIKQRMTQIESDANTYIVSINNLAWLLEQDHKAEGIIIDELPKACGVMGKPLNRKKNQEKITWRVGLTATPVAESLERLYDLFKILDNGETFGRNRLNFLNKYFYPTDFHQRNWALRPFAQEQLLALIAPNTYTATSDKKATLPPIHENTSYYTLPPTTQKAYDEMVRDAVIGEDIIAINAAVQSGKLRQIATGSVLNSEGEVVVYDRVRAGVALNWVKCLRGEQGLVFYEFDHQREAIEEAFTNANIQYVVLSGKTSANKKHNLLDTFKAHTVQVLVAQVQTLSHGVDGLQHHANDMLFYAPIWSNDTNIQARGRLWRTGQTKPVYVNTIMASNTVEELIPLRVEGKAVFHEALLDYFKGHAA